MMFFQVRKNKYKYGGTKTILGPAHVLTLVGRKNVEMENK